MTTIAVRYWTGSKIQAGLKKKKEKKSENYILKTMDRKSLSEAPSTGPVTLDGQLLVDAPSRRPQLTAAWRRRQPGSAGRTPGSAS